MEHHMTKRSTILILALALAGVPTVSGAGAAAAHASMLEETARGKITAVELDYHNFTIEVKGKEVRIFITEDTKYVVGGKNGTKADALKVGAKVKVKHTDNIAATVEVE
jgi:hypothetical protein